MALIPCPECGRMVSPNAEECPSCGAPVKELYGRQINSSEEEKEETQLGIEQSLPTTDTLVHTPEPSFEIEEQKESQDVEQDEQHVSPIETQSNAAQEKTEKKHRSWILILVIVGVLLLAGGVGFWFYRTNVYLPAKRDAEAARFYVLAESLKMRSSPEFDADYNKIGTYPYGTEILVYDSVKSGTEPYIYGKYAVKDVNGKMIKDKCVEGYMSYYYMANKADFFLLNSIFGNEDARDMLSEVRYKRALLNYFKQHHYRGNISCEKMIEYGIYPNNTSVERWQVFCHFKKAKSNNVYRSRKFRKDSKFTDLAVIIKNIDSGERRLLYFVFDDDESYRLLLEQPAPSSGSMRDGTLKLKELRDGTYRVEVEYANY